MSAEGWLGPAVAFLAGLLSFVSPCVLPMVPVYLAQIAGSAAEASADPRARRITFLHAVSFVIGFSVVFIALGASVGLVGYGLRDHQRLLAELAGVVIIVFGLHLTGLLRIPILYRTYQMPVPAAAGAGGGVVTLGGLPGEAISFGRSSIVGGGFALGWTPCIGPVLGSILGMAGTQGSVAHASLLLAFYSAGLAVPFLVVGAAVGAVTAQLKRLNRFLPAIEIASGVLLIAVGVLLIANRLTMFNGYFDFFGLGSKGL